MSKVKFLLLIFSMFALTARADVDICTNVGFFGSFLLEELKLTGNCDDPDQRATITLGPTGLQLTGFGNNPPIPMKLISDTEATVENVEQFGVQGHSGKAKVMDGSTINILLQNSAGGNCEAIAKGGLRCLYNVTKSSCSPKVKVNQRVCASCIRPCKDYNKEITVFVQGTPTFECDVELDRVDEKCGNCTGESIVPKS